MKANAIHLLNLTRQMGPRWVAYRAGYAFQRHSGWIKRRFPLVAWSSYSLKCLAQDLSPDSLLALLKNDVAGRFFIGPHCRQEYSVSLRRVLPPSAATEVINAANQIASGRLQFFSGIDVSMGWPPRWHTHPESGKEWPRVHWAQLPDMGTSDVKWIWEAGRFHYAYTLVRAYWLTGDREHAKTFWSLVESWRTDNPPNCGAHWMCGQECAIRVFAWCFALFGFLDAPETTPQRVATLVEMIAAHGDRIERNIAYAVSQKNNHAINEALSLWTIGLLFSFLPSAERWELKGRQILEEEARRQINSDGSYVQHSLNYHRLVLQSYAWAILLGDRSGRPFSKEMKDLYQAAAFFLYQLLDQGSGCVPNYGSNDGSLLFHLDSCDFSDYRPALALAFWTAHRKRPFESGIWDEPLLWLCGEQPLTTAPDPVELADFSAEQGGYYTLRGKDTWAFIRCCRYKDRPAQADMLHTDLWLRGINILADPGTYSYNGRPPWNNGLSGTDVHNALQLDGLDQMERGPHFTWFHWNNGSKIGSAVSVGNRIRWFEGQHDGYVRGNGVLHRRVLMLVDDKFWVVVDDVYGAGVHLLSSNWLVPKGYVTTLSDAALKVSLPDFSFKMFPFVFSVDQDTIQFKTQLVSGASNDVRGWVSHRYMQKEKALSIVNSARCALPARILTVFALAENFTIEARETNLLLASVEGTSFTGTWAGLQEGVVAKSTITSVTLQ